VVVKEILIIKKKKYINNQERRDTINIIVENMTICLQLSSNIDSENEFDIKDFARRQGSYFVPQEITITEIFNPVDNTVSYCGDITQSGLYFPIDRVDDWDQDEDAFNDTEKGFMYTVGALYFLAFLFVIIVMGITIYMHGWRGTCVNLFKAKQLAIWILALLLIFCGLRGFYLCLVPNETIDENTSLSVEALLTDLPIYVFFTLYMLLIFFWAELYHHQYTRKTSVLGNLRFPFFILNLFIYIFFVVILIVFSTSDANDQPTIEKVYKCIVAGIGFVILIGFTVYGGMLLYRTSQFSSTSKGSDRSQFLRLTFITVSCTISSLVQFIFLLLFTFTDIEDVTTVLVYMFVVELIPTYLLLWVFFNPTRIEQTLTQSYSSSSKEIRSFPGSKRSGRSSSRGGSTAGTDTD